MQEVIELVWLSALKKLAIKRRTLRNIRLSKMEHYKCLGKAYLSSGNEEDHTERTELGEARMS